MGQRPLTIAGNGLGQSSTAARPDADRPSRLRLARLFHCRIGEQLGTHPLRERDVTNSRRSNCPDSGHHFGTPKGVPITEFCDKNMLSTKDRLKLFINVCQAVQHAHQKGIIHRDLKPSNILLTLADSQPIVKVIDFGVAKAINQQLTEKTLFTAYGQMVGTPQYMSPEQAEMSCLDVDTRSDIYSLGVLLYELLTGTTPLAADQLRTAGYAELQRLIREEEPPKPSTRLSAMGETTIEISRRRSIEPSRLIQSVRGDLDWIVMKALAKEQSRRYDSANRLAEDVQRHLDNELVEARPPSAVYRMQKLYRRHRAWMTGISLAVVAIVAALCVAIWSAVEVAGKNEALQQVNADLQNALREWRHVLLERGIEAALRGDVDATLEIAAKARQADAPEHWILLIEGLAYQHSGDTTQARQRLTQAYRVAPNSLGIASACMMAAVGDQGLFVNANGEDATVELFGRLEKLKPSSEFRKYDLLFRGWSQVYEDPTRAIETIEELIDEKHPWPFTQAMLAMCLVHEASDTGKPEYAIRALKTIRQCEPQLPDNAFAMFVGLHCRLWACLIAEGHIDKATVLSETEALAVALKQHPSGWAADTRATYYDLIGHPAAFEEYKSARNDWWQASRATVMLRVDPDWSARNVSSFPEKNPVRAVGDACALSLTGHHERARRIYEKLSKVSLPFVRIVALEILLCEGDLDACQEASQEMLNEFQYLPEFYDPPFDFMQKRLRYLADEYDSEQFLASVDRSWIGECVANYLIAMDLRAQGDPVARDYFLACIDRKQFWMWQYQFSKTILEREYGVTLPPAIVP